MAALPHLTERGRWREQLVLYRRSRGAGNRSEPVPRRDAGREDGTDRSAWSQEWLGTQGVRPRHYRPCACSLARATGQVRRCIRRENDKGDQSCHRTVRLRIMGQSFMRGWAIE